MNEHLTAVPGYRVWEYLLVLQPHEELSNKIKKVKEDFFEKYQAASATLGRPQITLLKFAQFQMMEERVINRLKMIAMAMPAFKIELKDYGSFPSHTIYINIETKSAIQMLVKSIKPARRLLTVKDINPVFIESPQLTLARNLLPWQYEKGWQEYSNRHFTGRFIAKSMLLVGRPEGMHSYKPLQSFDFMNMPVVTTQGKLFV